LLPCLNDRPGWIEALAAIVRDGLGSWIGEARDGARAGGAARTQQLGATP